MHLGINVISLDANTPFSAARARNEGLQQITKDNPSIEFIQFLDGDCTLSSGWLEAAVKVLESDESLAAAFGIVEELAPNKSIYNRLCALEWQSPAGNIQSCAAFGGNSMVRVSAFLRVGGFNPQVIAGEDAELAARMLLAKFEIVKLYEPMAKHDANILHFTQWWRRSLRSGHAIGQRAHLHGHSVLKDCMRERTSVLVWGLAVPLFALGGLLISFWVSLGFMALYSVLAWKILRYRQKRENSLEDAIFYAAFIVLGKFPESIGVLRFWKNQLMEDYRIIEYK